MHLHFDLLVRVMLLFVCLECCIVDRGALVLASSVSLRSVSVASYDIATHFSQTITPQWVGPYSLHISHYLTIYKTIFQPLYFWLVHSSIFIDIISPSLTKIHLHIFDICGANNWDFLPALAFQLHALVKQFTWYTSTSGLYLNPSCRVLSLPY